jgi:hypothetical protein
MSETVKDILTGAAATTVFGLGGYLFLFHSTRLQKFVLSMYERRKDAETLSGIVRQVRSRFYLPEMRLFGVIFLLVTVICGWITIKSLLHLGR